MQKHLQKAAFIFVALLLLVLYKAKQQPLTANPVTTAATNTATLSTALPPVLVRNGLLLTRTADGRGSWTGFVLTERDQPQLIQSMYAKFGEGLTADTSFSEIAAGENSRWWWTLGYNHRLNVPVIGNIHTRPEGTSVGTIDLVPSQVASMTPCSNGRSCAMALKKDGYWQIALATQGSGEIQRTILSEPNQEAAAKAETLPLMSLPLGNGDHLMLVTRNPAALHNIIVMADRAVGHHRIPLDFDPQCASTYYVPDAQNGEYHILLAGRRGEQDVVTDLTCKETGVEAKERGRFDQDIHAPQGIQTVLARVRDRELSGMALAYRGTPALRVIHPNPDNRNQRMTTIFLPPGELQSGQASLAAPVTLPSGPYWLAAPFNSVLPDGSKKTILMLVDEFGRTKQIEKTGLTTSILVMDQYLIWLVRNGRGGDSLTALRITDFVESSPLALPAISGAVGQDRLIDEATGSKRVY